MHYLLIILAIFSLAACNADEEMRQSAGFAYIAELDDLPLPARFAVRNELTAVYDTPSGRIVELTAEGVGHLRRTTEFYENTLPALGWKKQADKQYARDGEILSYSIWGSGETLTIEFSLRPDGG